jgi:hypothetical protein
MAVYEANIRSLAEFISDTKLGFIPSEVTSTKGWRGDGSRYMISAHKINCDRIYVTNDCFIDIDGNIVVTSYIPAIKYNLISNELSPYYKNGEHLSFGFKTESQVLRYEIGKDVELNSYDDFQDCMDCLVEYIGQNIEKTINDFKGGSWKIDDVVCDILWQVDKIKNR